MTTKDEHGYPFEQEWKEHQAEPLPEFSKPKKRLPIRFNEMPPLPEKSATFPSYYVDQMVLD